MMDQEIFIKLWNDKKDLDYRKHEIEKEIRKFNEHIKQLLIKEKQSDALTINWVMLRRMYR